MADKIKEAIPEPVKDAAASVTETVKSATAMQSSGGPSTQVTRQQMADARLPLAYRDSCAHLLIPLNKCRREEWFLPWKCVDERHSYEKCQYDEFKLRVKKMEELKANAAQEQQS